MTSDSFSNYIEGPGRQNFIRLLENVSPNADPIVIILKGHLLIEEMLHEIIDENVKDRRCIRDAKLSFSQSLKIAKSFTEKSRQTWQWEAINKLNNLRNILSHQLREKLLIEKTQDFISFVLTKMQTKNKRPDFPGYNELYMAIMVLYGSLCVDLHLKKNPISLLAMGSKALGLFESSADTKD